MALENVVAYATKCYRATSRGAKILTRETKDLFANHTRIGRRLRAGIHDAREAVRIRMKVSDKSADLVSRAEIVLSDKGAQAVHNLRNDDKFMKLVKDYSQKRMGINGDRMPKEGLEEISDAQFIQAIIESCGVGPTKAAQIFSNNPVVMSQIEQKLGKSFAQAMQNTRSGCFPTRTVEEAQKLIDKAFEGKNIVIKKRRGTASIGETYLVTRPDGSEAIVKMVKNGVTKDGLQQEEKIMSRVAKELIDSPKDLAQVQGQLKTLYGDWVKELNFTEEFANNRLLAQGAKRYNVAKITDISPDASCIIMDKANGIQMNKLVEILKDYKANPTEFATKYAKEISANPWLANPEKVAKELPTPLLKTFDEQFMFMKKGGKSVMHGDPHTGNFFITANEKGKLIPEFIDTGSCVVRTGAQIKNDIKFFSNYLVGNSKGVAEYFVNQCPHKGLKSKNLVEKVAKDIQEEIFGKKQNIKKFSDVQANINAILERHGLHLAAENATAMKAQMQFFSAVSEAGKLTGQSVDIMTLMKDIPQACLGMVKCGVNPWGAVKDATKFAYYNQRQALGTAYQFTIKDVDKILKSNGALEAIA